MTTGMWALLVVVAVAAAIGAGLWAIQIRAGRFDRQAREDDDDFT